MARFLPVAPVDITRNMFEVSKRAPSVQHDIFLLAHDVVSKPKEWAAVNKHWQWKHSYSILDNSVIELKSAVDTAMIVDALAISKARTVVLPDVLEDGKASLAATLEVYDDWVDRFGNFWDPSKGYAELMFVPQGKDLQDWLACFEMGLRAMADCPPVWIGIPRNTTGRICHSRADLVKVVKAIYPQAKVHLLGFSDNVMDDLISARQPGANSIDSAVPVRVEDFRISAEAGPRGDWWDNHEVTDQQISNILHAQSIFRG